MGVLSERLIDAGCWKNMMKGIELYILKKMTGIHLVLL